MIATATDTPVSETYRLLHDACTLHSTILLDEDCSIQEYGDNCFGKPQSKEGLNKTS